MTKWKEGLFLVGLGIFLHDYDKHGIVKEFWSPYMIQYIGFTLPHHLWIGLGIMCFSWLLWLRKIYNDLSL